MENHLPVRICMQGGMGRHNGRLDDHSLLWRFTKMEDRIVTEYGINEELAELRFRMERLEELKDGKTRKVPMLIYDKDDGIHNLSFQFFLRLK
jgi:hypothetical protein